MQSSSPQECRPASTAVHQDDLLIPIIDFSPFLHGTPANRHAVAVSIISAFKSSGFLYLKDHGIPPSVVSRVFSSSSHFFARPQAQKDSLQWTTPLANRGYVRTGQEKLNNKDEAAPTAESRLATPDLKETMEIGREGVEGLPNHWPDHIDEDGKQFKDTMLSFCERCQALHTQIMRAIALGMNLPEHHFDSFVNAGDNTLRLLHYPAVSREVFARNPAQVRAGEHSDYGSITLLFQDRRGGLQVRSPQNTFVDVAPIADAVVVNAGDLLARWSNDVIKSTRHRVVEPPRFAAEEDVVPDTYPDRYSVAYFCNPNMDRWIEALPGTYGEGKEGLPPAKYPGITAGDYLVQRLTATYS